jgi:uncharacterized protein with von Willebrand factor type A (vWA) domain
MTMLSFRVSPSDAADATRWAERLGIERSELLRQALRLHFVRLASETDVAAWIVFPLDDGERALSDVADWGPAEDWSDWVDER